METLPALRVRIITTIAKNRRISPSFCRNKTKHETLIKLLETSAYKLEKKEEKHFRDEFFHFQRFGEICFFKIVTLREPQFKYLTNSKLGACMFPSYKKPLTGNYKKWSVCNVTVFPEKIRLDGRPRSPLGGATKILPMGARGARAGTEENLFSKF